MFSNKINKILEYIKKEGSKDNLEIRLIYNKMATYNGEVVSSGFFDYPEANSYLKSPILVIGIDKPEEEWIEVLLHEFNHYLQWRDKTDLWNKHLDLYIDNKEDKEETFEMIKSTVEMEAECERNTISFAQEINYPLDEIRYIKKVNAYLVFYQIYYTSKKWYKNPPFENESILNLMPKDIIEKPMDFLIDENLSKLYHSCL